MSWNWGGGEPCCGACAQREFWDIVHEVEDWVLGCFLIVLLVVLLVGGAGAKIIEAMIR